MSYTNLNYHIVFATKGRRPFLSPQHMPRVREYIGGIVRELRGRMLAANGPADHLHVALTADASTALADLVRTIKSNSSRWIRRTLPGLARFGWQDGYSAFSVSHSGVGKVVAYVQRQMEHHGEISFDDELLGLLERHGIEHDPRYLGA